MDETHEMSAYQHWEHGKLDDIDHDTDEILKCLKEDKHMEGFNSGLMAGLMNNRGIDEAGLIAMLNDRCRDGNWNEGGGIWIILLFLFMLGMGGNGIFGNRNGGVDGVDRTVVNEANYSRLLDAVGTNGTRQEMAIQGLANTLNCDVQAIQGALCGLDKQLALTNGNVINAIQSCCCNVRTDIMASQNALQSQMAKCCCDTNLNIERQGCQTRSDIQETRFLIQTTDAATRQLIQDTKCDILQQMNAGFCDLEKRELQERIHNLEDQIAAQRVDAQSAILLNAINGQKCINARYDTTNQSICGSVGARSCCCNRIGSTATPASTETAESVPARSRSKAKAE